MDHTLELTIQEVADPGLRSRLMHEVDKRTIMASGRFDADFYRRCYAASIPPDESPLDHFLRSGHAEGLLASAHFDPIVYKLRHPQRRHANPLVDSILKNDSGDYRDIAALFRDIDVAKIPVTFRRSAGLLTELAARAQAVAENVSVSVQLSGTGGHFELRNPAPELVLSRLTDNRPFCVARLTHGFWDTLCAIAKVVRRLRSDPLCGPLGDREVDNLAVRLMAREYLPKGRGGIYAENMLHEIQTDLLNNPKDEDFWTAVAVCGPPGFGNGLYGLDQEDAAERLEAISRFFSPSDVLHDATLWKRWALSGDLVKLAEAAREHPVILVGPEKFHALGAKWRLPRFRHVAIAPNRSHVVRYSILQRIQDAVRNVAADGGPARPVVFFQCGSLAYWFIRRLRASDSRAFYIDLGQALDLWQWNHEAPWMRAYGDALLAANPFAERSTVLTAAPPVNGLPDAPAGPQSEVMDALRQDYLDTGLMAPPGAEPAGANAL